MPFRRFVVMVYNGGMPDIVPQRERRSLVSQARQDKYIAALMKGYSVEQIACKVDPSKGRKYRQIKGEVQYAASQSQEFLEWQVGRAKGTIISNVEELGQALVARGKRGRTDAIKLGLEMTDIHNPKVKHQHSGDISINLNMPRPPRVENPAAQLDEPIVDAEVVE